MKVSVSAKQARCPICRDVIAEPVALPFCSERCRTVDLGNWLGEAYRIPVMDDSPPDEPATSDDE